MGQVVKLFPRTNYCCRQVGEGKNNPNQLFVRVVLVCIVCRSVNCLCIAVWWVIFIYTMDGANFPTHFTSFECERGLFGRECSFFRKFLCDWGEHNGFSCREESFKLMNVNYLLRCSVMAEDSGGKSCGLRWALCFFLRTM